MKANMPGARGFLTPKDVFFIYFLIPLSIFFADQDKWERYMIDQERER
jgi:hypothetical protein